MIKQHRITKKTNPDKGYSFFDPCEAMSRIYIQMAGPDTPVLNFITSTNCDPNVDDFIYHTQFVEVYSSQGSLIYNETSGGSCAYCSSLYTVDNFLVRNESGAADLTSNHRIPQAFYTATSASKSF